MADKGRPSKYTEKLATEIIDALIHGKSIVRMCKQDHWPVFQTICTWREKRPDFMERYERGQIARAEYLADEMLSIADDTESDVGFSEDEDKDGKGAKPFIIKENTAQRKLKLETRKWAAAHLMPNKFGDFKSIEVTGKNGEPLIGRMSDKEIDVRLKELEGK